LPSVIAVRVRVNRQELGCDLCKCAAGLVTEEWSSEVCVVGAVDPATLLASGGDE
jgi:hypothetical protein